MVQGIGGNEPEWAGAEHKGSGSKGAQLSGAARSLANDIHAPRPAWIIKLAVPPLTTPLPTALSTLSGTGRSYRLLGFPSSSSSWAL